MIETAIRRSGGDLWIRPEIQAVQSCRAIPPRPAISQVRPGSDLVPVDDEFGLWLVDLDVDQRGEGEHPALHGFHLQLLGELQDLPGLRRRRQDEFHREVAAAGEGRRRRREDPDPGDLLQLLLDPGEDLEDVPLPLVPRLDDHPAEPGVGKVIWKVKSFSGSLWKTRFASAEKMRFWSSVANWRTRTRMPKMTPGPRPRHLLGGHEEHRHGGEGHRDPYRVHRRTRRQRGVEKAAVGVLQPFETAGDPAGQAVLLHSRL